MDGSESFPVKRYTSLDESQHRSYQTRFGAEALHRALAAFSAPVKDLMPADFAKPGSFFSYGKSASNECQ